MYYLSTENLFIYLVFAYLRPLERLARILRWTVHILPHRAVSQTMARGD